MLADSAEQPPRRPIRSYVLRQGRLSPAQRRACDDLFPRYGVPFATGPVDWPAIFGRVAPVVLEIGFGMGETTAAIADVHRDIDFIAVDVHLPGVGSLLIDSVFQRDIPTVQGCILMIVLFFLLINTLVDLAYVVIDPRIRYG